MQALLVGPLASVPDLKAEIRSGAKAVLAVDAGLDVCLRAKVPPLFSVGDWDGTKIPKSKLPENRWDLPIDKDRSDLAYALKLLADEDFTEIRAIGFQGGRLDQELAVHLDFLEAVRSYGLPISSHGPRGETHYLTEKMDLRLRLDVGTTVSVFPLDVAEARVKYHGFRYGSDKKPFRIVRSQGLSNLTTSQLQRIWCKKGTVLVMVPHANSLRKESARR